MLILFKSSAEDSRTAKKWISNPFIFRSGESTLPARQEDQLLDIANDGSLKCIFHTTTLPMFWMKVLPEYPDLAIKALKTLLPFSTSYLCESAFSVMAASKTKPLNRLDVRDTLRVPLKVPYFVSGSVSLRQNKLKVLIESKL